MRGASAAPCHVARRWFPRASCGKVSTVAARRFEPSPDDAPDRIHRRFVVRGAVHIDDLFQIAQVFRLHRPRPRPDCLPVSPYRQHPLSCNEYVGRVDVGHISSLR